MLVNLKFYSPKGFDIPLEQRLIEGKVNLNTSIYISTAILEGNADFLQTPKGKEQLLQDLAGLFRW